MSVAGSMVTQKSPMEELSSLSSAMMIYIVVAVIIALLVIIDLSCFVIGNTGKIIYILDTLELSYLIVYL